MHNMKLFHIQIYSIQLFQICASRVLTWECSEDGITLLAGGGDQPPTYSMSCRRPSNCTVSVKKDCNEIAQVSDRQSGCNVGLLLFFPENNTCSLRQQLFIYLCINPLLKVILSLEPRCHKSCFKLILHYQCNSEQFTQRTQLMLKTKKHHRQNIGRGARFQVPKNGILGVQN